MKNIKIRTVQIHIQNPSIFISYLTNSNILKTIIIGNIINNQYCFSTNIINDVIDNNYKFNIQVDFNSDFIIFIKSLFIDYLKIDINIITNFNSENELKLYIYNLLEKLIIIEKFSLYA